MIVSISLVEQKVRSLVIFEKIKISLTNKN